MSDPGTKAIGRPTVFVVDDDDGVRTATSRLLRSHGFDVEGFESATDFLASVPEAPSACLLLDLRMPGLTGLALQERMTELGILYPIVFVTGHGDVPASVRAMKGGAVDFLQKPFDEEVLLEAISRALDLHGFRREKDRAARDVDVRVARLTDREAEVMELVAQGMRNSQVAEQLGISERTVKVHRGRMMKKLELTSLPELVRMIQVRDDRPIVTTASKYAAPRA